MRGALRVIGGLLLAAVLLWVVLRGQDPDAIRSALARAAPGGLLVGAALNLGHNLFRVWRWRALLEPVRPGLPARPLWSAILIGYMTTWVLPGRLGELVRPALLSGRQGVPLGPCLGSVLTDRLLDGWAIVVLFAVGSWTTPLPGGAARHVASFRGAAAAILAAACIGLVTLAMAAAHRERLEVLLHGRRGLAAWLLRAFAAVAHGSDAMRRPLLLARVAAHSLLAWLVIDLATWAGVRAAGAAVPFGAILILMPLLALGIAVPTPGGVGGYHAAMAFGLGLFGVAPEVALSAGILMHLVVTIPVILAGLLLLRWERISWHDVRATASEVRHLGRTRTGEPA